MKQRRYSLFMKKEGRYIRLSSLSFRKPNAVRFFQNSLIAGSLRGRSMHLRPVEGDDFSINSGEMWKMEVVNDQNATTSAS